MQAHSVAMLDASQVAFCQETDKLYILAYNHFKNEQLNITHWISYFP